MSLIQQKRTQEAEEVRLRLSAIVESSDDAIIGKTLTGIITSWNAAIARDITERKQIEQNKDDFISVASHELKTPLTSQKLFLQLLHREMKKNGDTRYEPLLAKAQQQNEKMTKLIS